MLRLSPAPAPAALSRLKSGASPGQRERVRRVVATAALSCWISYCRGSSAGIEGAADAQTMRLFFVNRRTGNVRRKWRNINVQNREIGGRACPYRGYGNERTCCTPTQGSASTRLQRAAYYKVYPNLGPPRQWAYTPMAYSVAPRSFSGYYPAYPNLRPLRQWAYTPMAYSVAPSSFSGFYPAYPNLRP